MKLKKKCSAGIRDKRPVPELKFPIDAALRAKAREERAALHAAEAAEAEENRRQKREAESVIGSPGYEHE